MRSMVEGPTDSEPAPPPRRFAPRSPSPFRGGFIDSCALVTETIPLKRVGGKCVFFWLMTSRWPWTG
jgi:hypothetical protein